MDSDLPDIKVTRLNYQSHWEWVLAAKKAYEKSFSEKDWHDLMLAAIYFAASAERHARRMRGESPYNGKFPLNK